MAPAHGQRNVAYVCFLFFSTQNLLTCALTVQVDFLPWLHDIAKVPDLELWKASSDADKFTKAVRKFFAVSNSDLVCFPYQPGLSCESN